MYVVLNRIIPVDMPLVVINKIIKRSYLKLSIEREHASIIVQYAINIML